MGVAFNTDKAVKRTKSLQQIQLFVVMVGTAVGAEYDFVVVDRID